MRALLQRVSGASVAVQGTVIGQIGAGFVVLVCAMQEDGPAQAERLAAKIAKLRVFKDSAGKMNLSLGQVGGSALIISQFTLAADLRGNRPGFSSAAPPAEAEALYHTFCLCIEAEGIAIATGSFGADMQVSLTNDGPVTIWMDTDQL